MRVPASPLLVFGFASAATVSWGAPASPALLNFRVPHSPAMSSSAQNSPAPSYAATFGSPAPDHSATFSPNPAIGDGGDSYTGQAGQAEGAEMGDHDMSDQFAGITGQAKVLDAASDDAGNGGEALSGDSVGGYGSSQGGNAYTGSGGSTNGGSMLQSRYAADGDAGLARGDLNPQDSAITGDKEAFNMLSGSGGDGGRASSGNAVGASAASAYDVRPVRQDDLGIDRLRTGAVVSSRKGEMRRSRLRRGLGVTGLDGIGGSTGSMAMPAVADLEDLHLS